jgi:hypothetical protein
LEKLDIPLLKADIQKWFCWLKDDSKAEWVQFLEDSNILRLQSPFEEYHPLSMETLRDMRRNTDDNPMNTLPGPSTQFALDRFAQEEQVPMVSKSGKLTSARINSVFSSN